jgi:hypothetical protein
MVFKLDIAFSNPSHPAVDLLRHTLRTNGIEFHDGSSILSKYAEGQPDVTLQVIQIVFTGLSVAATLLAPLMPQFRDYVKKNWFRSTPSGPHLTIQDEDMLNSWLSMLQEREEPGNQEDQIPKVQ